MRMDQMGVYGDAGSPGSNSQKIGMWWGRPNTTAGTRLFSGLVEFPPRRLHSPLEVEGNRKKTVWSVDEGGGVKISGEEGNEVTM